MENLYDIKLYLREFAKAREWQQYHSPKNLAMALTVEAAELQEIFQWLSEPQSEQLDAATLEKAAEEIADVQLYLVRLADQLGIDIMTAVNKKAQKNEQRYPAEQVRGSAKKYTEY